MLKMKILWTILGLVLSGSIVTWNNLSTGDITQWNNSTPVDVTVSENISQDEKNWPLTHLWFSEESYVQNIVNYAYKLWGMDFVLMLECENGSYKLDATGDRWRSRWLCMVNDRWHKDIPADYTTNWVVAVEYCYHKWSNHTKFYWPNRKVKWMKCKDYVRNRFRFN